MRRRFAPPPSASAIPQSLHAAAISANRSASPPWTIPLPRSGRPSLVWALGGDARPRHLGPTTFPPIPCPSPANRRLPIGEKGAAQDDRAPGSIGALCHLRREPWRGGPAPRGAD